MNRVGHQKALGKMAFTVLLTMMLIAASIHAAFAQEHDAERLLVGAIRRYKTVQSYTCLLDKRVAEAGTLYEDLAIRVKFKKPASYYFRWETGRRKGREAIFVSGRHEETIIAHPGGMFRFMTFRLDPEGGLAMKENRHPLTNSGLGKIMQLVEADVLNARQQGVDAIRFVGESHVDGLKTWVVQGRFPENRGFYASRVVLYLDQSLNLPIKVSIFDASNTLVEEYVFHHLAIDIEFTDADFDPANPKYDFLHKDRK